MIILVLLTTITSINAQFPPIPVQFQMSQPNGNPFQSLGPSLPQQMPMHFPFQQRLPAVVMPYVPKHHKKTRYHRRRSPKRVIEDSNSESCSDEDFRRSSRVHRRRQVLTPVISYITKDGNVVYQKKVKRERARDWLDIGRNPSELENEWRGRFELISQENLQNEVHL